MRFVRRGHSTTLARLDRLTGPLALAALLFAAPTAGCSTATFANDADAAPADSGTTAITGPTRPPPYDTASAAMITTLYRATREKRSSPAPSPSTPPRTPPR